MKSKVFKIMLPAFAILLAISLSFATEATNSSQIGYYFDSNLGEIVSTSVDCNSTSPDPCEVNGHQVFAERELLNALYKTTP
jgi:hypothetical protein